MKSNIRITSTLLTLLLFHISLSSFGNEAEKFLGRWALHFEQGMGWLEVRQEDGYLDADLLWKGGSVTPVANVYVSNGKLYVTRTSEVTFKKNSTDERIHTATNILSLEGTSNGLIGTYLQPRRSGDGADITYVRADKIPSLPAAPDLSLIKFDKPIELIKDGLSGWKLTDSENVNGWTVEKGILTNNPVQKDEEKHIRYGNLRTVDEFEDFNLQLSVNVPKGSNSGVYLRGIYEVQVVDSYGNELDSHNMGALYSRITPLQAAEKKAGKWQKMDITLFDRHLTVILNGKKIIDNHPVFGVTGGAITSNEFNPGPILLQGDHGAVSYKDIVITPIVK